MARFLQLTDLHIVKEGARASNELDTRNILKAAIDRLISLNDALAPIDAVLISGDLSDDGSADSYSFLKEQLSRLGLPMFIVPGNHDLREQMRKAFSDICHMPGSGLIEWVRKIGNTVVIGLDTLVEGQSRGQLRLESIDRVARALQTIGSEPVIIMLHHPPIKTGIRFMDAIGLENSSALMEAIQNIENEIIVISGHVHGIHFGRLGGHVVATAPSICSNFALDRRLDAPVGFWKGSTGCAVIDTEDTIVWSALSLENADGPFSF